MIPESSPYRLLVEGSDDKHCVIHLLQRHGVDWDMPGRILPFVHDCTGFDPLLSSLGVSAKSHERLGVMVDANADLRRRWIQMKEGFRRVGITLPESPCIQGTIVPGIYPDWRVGVWLMPDNRSHGQLEDFLGRLVPGGDRCWSYAAETTQRARGLGAKFPEKAISKATIHTWLAWQENPGLQFGTAITAEYFSVDSPEALSFVDWFSQLFS